MKLGLQLTYFTYPGGPSRLGATFGQIAQAAEAAGFDSLWVMDHYFQIGGWGPKDAEMLEAYTALGYAAALTQRIRLGVLVNGVTYRQPGLLIKTATTLDVLSGGRTYFGIGAAWNETEHRGLGVPYPPLGERITRLEETLQLAHQMWRDDRRPFDGQYLHLAEPINQPPALQIPHPPILVGGDGEQKILRLVARYADACNIIIITDPGVDYHRGIAWAQRKFDVLQRWCATENRPYEEIEKTTLSAMVVSPDGTTPPDAYHNPEGHLDMTPAQAVDYFGELAAAGVDHAIFNTPVAHLPGAFDLWASDVVPAVHAMVPAGR